MSGLDFSAVFEALTGHRPFLWQKRLFQRFLQASDRLPDSIDIPTGLGKTSVMAIWLAALAEQARAGAPTLPRRLVYVVDRRTVVDQASEVASQLAKALKPGAEGIQQHLRRNLGLSGSTKLAVCTMRGGRADDREWLYDPTLPGIVVGTVDLVGSRLLFCGYRLSGGMRPWAAGLLGSDALIVVDEAHIAPAFEKAVRRVLDLRMAPQKQLVPELQLMTLSATRRGKENGAAVGSSAFGLEHEDRADEGVARRLGLLGATKRIRLNRMTGNDALADALAQSAIRHDGNVTTVLVYADLRRDGAVKAANRLRKLLGPERACDVLLLTGAIRGFERDALADKPDYHAFRGEAPLDGRTRYLVCTAAGEVGADLDAEAAVMDLVPLERMVQRLGRVNRTGRPTAAPVTVIVDPATLTAPEKAKEDAKAKAARLAATYDALQTLEASEDGLDASPLSLRDLLAKHPAAVTPPPPIPTIEREHVEAWALTSLKQHAGRPDVEPFIRGLEEDAPQASIAWRPDVGSLAQLSDAQIEAALAVARLRPAELLETTPREVAEWLQARIRELRKPKKVVALNAGADEATPQPRTAIALVFRAGRLQHRLPVLCQELYDGRNEAFAAGGWLLAGDVNELAGALREATVLIDATAGGLNQDGALNAGTNEDVPCANDALLVTLTPFDKPPDVISWPCDADLESVTPNDPKSWRREGWRPVHSVRLPASQPNETEGETPGPLLEYWTRRWSPDGDTTLTRRECALDVHLMETRDELERTLHALGIGQRAPELANAMIAAMHLHDIGKRRQRMQRALGGTMRKPLAKSGHNRPLGLEGYRHEFGSLRDALDPTGDGAPLVRFSGPLRDLALHLIASHHGYVRPDILALDEDDIAGWHVGPDAVDAALRFIRLQREWGPWGLAWLEAVFRAADAKVSRDWDRGDAATAALITPTEAAA